MKVGWNLIKASFRVINPKETLFLEADDKFDRQVFTRNVTRTKAVVEWIIDAFKVFKMMFEWESKKLNIIALAIWLLLCTIFRPWMLPLIVLVPFVYYRPEKYKLFKRLENQISTVESIDGAKGEKEEKSSSLRQKIQSLQDLIQTVQNMIGSFASLGESIKNLCNFTVPFLSFLAIFMLILIAFVMYLIPVRYIFMIWGIHKFTRKILRPNRIPNNEILDLLSRVPDDEILQNYEELPLEDVPENDSSG